MTARRARPPQVATAQTLNPAEALARTLLAGGISIIAWIHEPTGGVGRRSRCRRSRTAPGCAGRC